MSAGRSAQAVGRRNAIATAVAVAFLLALTAVAQAGVPIGTGDIRVSTTGGDTDTARGAADNAVAYNSADDEYLVVWYADGQATDNEFEIYGQRIDGATGEQIGGDFRISNVGTNGDATRGTLYPSVAYNETDNQYLVVWQADGMATDDQFEIYGQVLSGASGGEVGSDFQISEIGTDGQSCGLLDHPHPGAFRPAVTYNSSSKEYLVVWSGDNVPPVNPCNGEQEIYGQRVSAAGAQVGTNDFRISTVGNDEDATRNAEFAAVAYNSTANQYLVVWDDDRLANDKVEIFGQRLAADGADAGGSTDFQISNSGSAISRFAERPTVAYGSQLDEYLVAWEGNGPPITDTRETEIFGQRIDAATGAQIVGDFRISSVGADNDPNRDGLSPAAAYNSPTNEYVVAWYGDGLETDNEFETFGQRLSSAGAEISGDFRISAMGAEGDKTRGAFEPAIAASSNTDGELVSWYGDGLATDGKLEVFAHRLGIPPPAPTNLVVTESGKIVKASWSLPANTVTGYLEFSPTQATFPDGSFSNSGKTSYHYNSGVTTFDSTPVKFPAGATYYVHVSAHDPTCDCDQFTSPVKLVISPDAAVGPTGSSGTPFRLDVRAARFQRALRTKQLTLRVTCNARCSVTAATRMSVPRASASKTYKLRNVRRTLTASKTTTVRVKLSNKVVRAAKRALKKRKRVTAAVTVTARNSSGAKASVKRSIRVRR